MLSDTASAPTVWLASPPPGQRGLGLHLYLGDTSALPSELVGSRITVQLKNGQSWATIVTAVLERSSEQVIVTDSGRPATL